MMHASVGSVNQKLVVSPSQIATRSKALAAPSHAVRALQKVNKRASKFHVLTTASNDDGEFKRSPAQQALYELDSSVRRAQVDMGKGIAEGLKGPLSFLGVGGSKATGKQTWGGKALEQRWEYQWEELKKTVKSLDAEETKALMKKGWVLLDVRPLEDYEGYHPVGAKNSPLNQYISGSSPKQLLRASLFKMQAVAPIEPNPDFVEQAQEAIGKAPGVIVACAAGGTLQSTTNFPCGQPSRSLLAAYRLLDTGACKNVMHLKGGLNTWFRMGYDGEGTDDEWNDESGRTPSAAGYTPVQDSDELAPNQK